MSMINLVFFAQNQTKRQAERTTLYGRAENH